MPTENEDKITVCKVLKYEKDVEPFPLVKIYSGVGSGKSYFASCMVTGSEEYHIPKQTVLIITSRRAKVEETLKELKENIKEEITKNGNLSEEVFRKGEDSLQEYLRSIKFNNDIGEHEISFYNKSAVCTNAFISAYLRYVYDPEDPLTHIWNKFDAIVIDEVHSLVTDSTYQTATFDVLSLIEEYLKLYKENKIQEGACKHMILMTGTPKPFEGFVKLDFPDDMTKVHTLFKECENVVPKNVILIDELSAKRKILELLGNGEKVIYFSNHVLIESNAIAKFGVPKGVNVGVSFSKEEKKNALLGEEKEKVDRIENSLSESSLIPEDIQFFVTTSRNKEGININNKDYANMFVETHLMYDAVQMAGRVRKGLENFYIITNVKPIFQSKKMMDRLFSKKVLVANELIENSDDKANQYFVNEYMSNFDKEDKSWDEKKQYIQNYVDYIEKRFDYVRYNVFKQKFEYFITKERAENLAITQEECFTEMMQSDKNTMVERWFDNSNVSRELSPVQLVKMYLDKIFGGKGAIKLSREEFLTHMAHIRKVLGVNQTQPSAILKLIDKNLKHEQSNGKHTIYYGVKNPLTKKRGKAMWKRKQ